VKKTSKHTKTDSRTRLGKGEKRFSNKPKSNAGIQRGGEVNSSGSRKGGGTKKKPAQKAKGKKWR